MVEINPRTPGFLGVPCEAYILFLKTLTMCSMGVAMIYVGATYEDDVSTYLIVSGIFKSNIYLLPLLLVSIYIIETQNGVNFWSKYEAVSYLPIYWYTFPARVRQVPLAYILAYLGILIWGAIKAIGKKSS